MQWYLNVIRRYAVFQGRARRKEYWMFALIHAIIVFILAMSIELLDLNHLILVLYVLAIILPYLALSVRRLHDIGKSGWWLLLAVIPYVGDIILFVFACLDSEEDSNEYGPNPKYLLSEDRKI